jgi:hypothetical protein
MIVWPLILNPIIKFLLFPITLFQFVLAHLLEQYTWLSVTLATDSMLTVAMLWKFGRWLLLALIISGLVIFIVIDTARRILLAGPGKKTWLGIISDFLIYLLVLFLYYIIITLVLYLFFNFVLPLARII